MKINLPIVIIIQDYREVSKIKSYFRKLLGNSLKVKEILGEDFTRVNYQGYAALVYINKMPNRQQIEELFLQAEKE